MSDRAQPEPLTPREKDILRGVVDGLSNADIAERLYLSAGTVKWYVKQLYGKLQAHSREEAISRARSLGLVEPRPAGGPPGLEIDPVCPLINPLPLDVSGRYVGNLGKLSELGGLLKQPARLISVYGRAGSGKTALVCRALGDLRQPGRRPPWLSGIVAFSAAGADFSLNRLLADLGRLLSDREQASVEAVARDPELTPAQKIGFCLSTLGPSRAVVLLDNLETLQRPDTGALTESWLQQFIEIAVTQSNAVTLVITSREPLALPRSLRTWEHAISLESGLPVEDAVALLRMFDPAGAAGLRDATSAALAEVAERLGGFPRALEAVAGMLLEDPLLRFADLRRDFDALQGEISASVVERALARLGADATRVMQALAVYGQPVGVGALTFALSDFMAESGARSVLGRLIGACFVKANRDAGEFSLHPLDQAYCYARIPERSDDPAIATRPALHTRAALYFRGMGRPRSEWLRLADIEAQISEFRHWVRAANGDEAARLLLEIDSDFLWEWGYFELLNDLRAALEPIPIRDARLAQQVARRRAWAKFFVAPAEADREFAQLLAEARRQGFAKEEADALDDLAQTCRRGNRDPRQAIEYHEQALALYRRIGERRGEANALGGLGAVYAEIEPEEAIDRLLPAVEIHREHGYGAGLSFALSMLSAAYENLGAINQAVEVSEQAVKAARAQGSAQALSRAYAGLARVCIASGDIERGRACIDESRVAVRALAGSRTIMTSLFFSGMSALYLALANEFSQAISLMEEAIRSAAESMPGAAPFANTFLCAVLTLARDYPRARSLLPRDPAGFPPSWFSFAWLGVLLIKTGEPGAAMTFFERFLESGGNLVSGVLRQDASAQLKRILAWAGLAMLKGDHGRAGQARSLAAQAAIYPNWEARLTHAFLEILAEERQGELIRAVRDSLAARLHPPQTRFGSSIPPFP